MVSLISHASEVSTDLQRIIDPLVGQAEELVRNPFDDCRCPGMFTVSERHNPHTYYPVELLTVAPSQRVTLQQQTPDQVATMIKVVWLFCALSFWVLLV